MKVVSREPEKPTAEKSLLCGKGGVYLLLSLRSGQDVWMRVPQTSPGPGRSVRVLCEPLVVGEKEDRERKNRCLAKSSRTADLSSEHSETERCQPRRWSRTDRDMKTLPKGWGVQGTESKDSQSGGWNRLALSVPKKMDLFRVLQLYLES